MAYKVALSGNYATHLAALIQAVNKTDGDVLELGIGTFSTPYLHYPCLVSKRHLTSYDNEKGWVRKFATSKHSSHMYQGSYHDLFYVKNWDDAEIERPWDVALVDHSPDHRRIVEIKRLANFAKYIVVHDTNGRFDKKYHYSKVYPLFKYKTDWVKEERHATVLSNFVNLDDFWK